MIVIALLLSLLGLLAEDVAYGADISREVSAQEVLKKIQNSQPVDYDDVIIIGDIDLSQSDLPKDLNGKPQVKAPVKIKRSTIEGGVNFANSIISQEVDFAGTIFVRDAVFSGAEFSDQLKLESASFNEDASFAEAKFRGEATFNKAKFAGSSNFYKAEFGNDVGFFGTQFRGDSNFNKAIFKANSNFDGSTFNSYANFVGSSFLGDISFYQVKFQWNANFADGTLSGTAYLKGAKFEGLATFTGTEFGKYVSFEGADFKGDAYFDSAQFRSSYFWGTKFASKLLLNDSQFALMQIQWDSIRGNLVYNEATYLSLIKNFEVLGYYADSDNCYYQYRNEKMARETSLFAKAIDEIALISCGFGVRPINSVIISVLVVIFFGLMYWLGKAVPESVFEDLSMRFVGNNIQILFPSIYFSALAFITPHASIELRPYRYWKYVVYFEHIMGWLLMTLFIVTLGRVMIR
jgi:hypothetical protein